MDWRDKKVLVLGLGDTGLSLVRWLTQHGAQVRAADSREAPPHASLLRERYPQVALTTGSYAPQWATESDYIAISPGVAMSEVNAVPSKLIGDVEIFAQALQPRRAKLIAITGANGKTTVTTMCGEMCKEAGLETVVAGNIGLPVLDALSDIEQGKRPMPDVFVLELSSFQLETLTALNADAATVLNITQDHLDRYNSMEDYAAAKRRIFSGGGVQIINREDEYSRGMALPGRVISTFGLEAPANDSEWGMVHAAGQAWLAHGREKLIPVTEIPVTGAHNAANALAALALCTAIGLPMPPLLAALRRFRGLPHRVERVMEVDGVVFYDDSKGTNVGATVAALSGLRQPVVLIAGGDGKGQDFAPLKTAIARYARGVILMGRDAGQIAIAIEGCGVPPVMAYDMDDAVRCAFQAAEPGDAVLLSPACASFDMFRNYEHRAQVFIESVRKLSAERGT